MNTFLLVLCIASAVQYFIAIIILLIDSTEREMSWKVINTKRKFIAWFVPFGYMLLLYYYIIELWGKLDDQ